MTTLGLFKDVVRDALGFMQAHRPNPAVFSRSNLPRFGLYDSASDSGNAALTTQIMTAVPIFLAAGDVITNLSFQSGATAAGTPTNWWFALYDNSATPALLAQTADQTTGAWAANTVKTLALSSPVTIKNTGVYWAAVMVKATTVPTLVGSVVGRPVATGEINLAVTSGSTLAATAPATLATPTAQGFAPYCVAT